MAQTISELFATVRDQLQDTRVPYRHSDAKLVRYLNGALRDARRLRPDLFLPGLADTAFSYTAANVTDNTQVPVEESYLTPFIEYVTGLVSVEEDEYVEDSRAAMLLTRFNAKLVGRGV